MAEPPPEEDLKPQVYREERDASEFARFHERVRTREPDWIYGLARLVLTPIVVGPLRLRAFGLGNVPRTGPVVLAPNHFSGWDHFIVAALMRRPVHFMAKSQLFAHPVLEFILSHGGAFPVRRGTRDEETFVTSYAILERGGVVLLYPEGGRSRTGRPGTPRRGVGRIALESGAPVIPVAVHGTLQLRRWRRNFARLRIPPVTVWYGEPMRFGPVASPDGAAQQAAAAAIFGRVHEMYAALDAALASNSRRSVLRAARVGQLPG
jgi:1-acyl-sn-glycerol-3-phosphate acyltransferase